MSVKQHNYDILRPGDLVEISNDFYYPERGGTYYGLVIASATDFNHLLVYHFKNSQIYYTSPYFVKFYK